ncbi:putative Ribosome assembly protein 3 [Glarea lozoyensis 74030]|uniref:Ribosome assembly protein 3 n=1 Tax=Glarea lozoyensis (strain ATCC 74030 / MF5533) TaxID=1104152 RepID=H0EL91_GLAL7|nr:putative Ribosome assembly protein 3 [Glarea lozoyensis 74030]
MADAKRESKPKRRKKNKSRTHVNSDSDTTTSEPTEPISKPSPSLKSSENAEVSAAFTKFYMQRATVEFAEDLDAVRNAGDFTGDALEILVHALQQGTNGFSEAEKRRVVGGEARK